MMDQHAAPIIAINNENIVPTVKNNTISSQKMKCTPGSQRNAPLALKKGYLPLALKDIYNIMLSIPINFVMMEEFFLKQIDTALLDYS